MASESKKRKIMPRYKKKVWSKKEDADEVYRIMCNLDNGFRINYFVDKLSDLELKEYQKVNRI